LTGQVLEAKQSGRNPMNKQRQFTEKVPDPVVRAWRFDRL
jgi:hypothetical protein